MLTSGLAAQSSSAPADAAAAAAAAPGSVAGCVDGDGADGAGDGGGDSGAAPRVPPKPEVHPLGVARCPCPLPTWGTIRRMKSAPHLVEGVWSRDWTLANFAIVRRRSST